VIPEQVPNHVDGEDVPAASGEWIDKHRPAHGSLLTRVARSGAGDVAAAVAAARRAQPAWAEQTVVARGELVRELALSLREQREEL
jgi:acyl-CoA reductase-like NAD-dependent aldehyde dehydrogenase